VNHGFPREERGYTIRRLGPLAQLVEQGTLNPKVVGSIPTRPIIDRSPLRLAPQHDDFGRFFV
jgi:hypothetical protein